jgi:CO/xanthine dehydrogenase FAD-binding subunit
MKYWNHYLLPKTVDEALSDLRDASGLARVVSGGTDLLLDIRQGRHPSVDTLIDVSGVSEMRNIHSDESWIYLGAAVVHREIIKSSLLQLHAACLVQACNLIGGPQVRNVATIGGNVAHALPAGDGTIALLALDAEVEIASPVGCRWMRLEDLFRGPGEVVFNRAEEILVQFRIPLQNKGESSVFQRIMRPQGVAIAILNMALWLRVSKDRVIEDLRLAVGPAGPKPFRARMTEDAIRGRQWDEESVSEAAEVLRAEAKVRSSSHRATKEYRLDMLGFLLSQIFHQLF